MNIALAAAMRPIEHILSDPKTEDLAIQECGVGWWLKEGAWHRTDLPSMTYDRLRGISVMAAAQARQVINSRAPILSADLPGTIRLHSVMHPAVPASTIALTFRRGDSRLDEVSTVTSLFETGRWNQWTGRQARRAAQDSVLLDRYDSGDIEGFLTALVETKQTGLFCGPTGAGKSRMSKMCGGVIPPHERIITIEDALELVLRQPNNVRHFYSSSGVGVTAAELMKATLRERPDRVLLGEMRDPEAVAVFIDEVMAGHPGSMSTIHGRNPAEAARRLFNLFKASPSGRSMEAETVTGMLATAIDFIIPVENEQGSRSIGEIWFAPDAARRGESFADLLVDR